VPTHDNNHAMADNIAPTEQAATPIPAAASAPSAAAPDSTPGHPPEPAGNSTPSADPAKTAPKPAEAQTDAPRYTTERPPFLPVRGEVVQYRIGAQHLRSVKDGKTFIAVDGDIWLTSHRIWFEPRALGGDALRMAMKSFGADKAFALPLCHVQKVGERTVESKPALRLLFANKGREYFRVNHIDRWIKTIRAVQPNAPELEFTRIPPLKHGVDRFRFPWGLLKLATGLALAAAAAYYYGRGRWF
jgi:hypothetical protein